MRRTSLTNGVLTASLLALALFGAAGCSSDSPTGPGNGGGNGGGGTAIYQTITTLAGTGISGLSPDGLDPLLTEFSLPQDLGFAPNGTAYLLDWNNHRVRIILNGVVQTVIGTGELGNADEGPAIAAKLNHPTHVSFEGPTSVILAAWHNSKIMRLDTTTGMLTRICGDGARTFSGDGGPAIDAQVDLPTSTAVAPNGDIYLTDQASVRIRKIEAATGIITTVVGTGVAGHSGDGGPADQAQINLPQGQAAFPFGRIVLDGGYLYITDSLNNCIRRVNLSTGIIETVAGTGSPTGAFSGDGGPATDAELSFPADIDLDDSGNLYICDTFNNRIRKVDAAGVITTLVGNGEAITDRTDSAELGDGGPPANAKLDRPYGIAFDAQDNLYIADTHNNRFRVVMK